MEKSVEVFKALAEETRLRIMHLLITSEKELCCCELTDSLEEPQYNVSRHLKILKQAGLIGERREGRWVYSYAVPTTDEFLKQLFGAINSLSDEILARDKENLKARLQIRVHCKCVRGIQKTHLAGLKAVPK